MSDTQVSTQVVFSVDENSTLLPSIAFVRDKVAKHNQGKFSNLAKYSVEGFIEYLLELGVESCVTAVDADIKRRNEKAYIDAMAKLTAPANANDAAATSKYFMQIAALKRKFGIGGTQAEV